MQNKTETRKHSGLSSLSSLIIKSNVLGLFHQQCSYQYHGADTSKTLWYFKWEGVGLDGWISGGEVQRFSIREPTVLITCQDRFSVAPWEGRRWMDLRGWCRAPTVQIIKTISVLASKKAISHFRSRYVLLMLSGTGCPKIVLQTMEAG